LKRVIDGRRRNGHQPIEQQWQVLSREPRGHYGHFGILGNPWGLVRFRNGVVCAWHKWLDRRSGRARAPWGRMCALLEPYPRPPARVLRPYAPA
jgi:hypothetical protein